MFTGLIEAIATSQVSKSRPWAPRQTGFHPTQAELEWGTRWNPFPPIHPLPGWAGWRFGQV